MQKSITLRWSRRGFMGGWGHPLFNADGIPAVGEAHAYGRTVQVHVKWVFGPNVNRVAGGIVGGCHGFTSENVLVRSHGSIEFGAGLCASVDDSTSMTLEIFVLMVLMSLVVRLKATKRR
mmetsp:Transcript_14320/g.24472  ORF Transcript_14320/g.24472 Transcript_14320/m.24472 type:complete len:120 (+) Transcript_14320:508-867(+)